jgi:hypothetical protein
LLTKGAFQFDATILNVEEREWALRKALKINKQIHKK